MLTWHTLLFVCGYILWLLVSIPIGFWFAPDEVTDDASNRTLLLLCLLLPPIGIVFGGALLIFAVLAWGGDFLLNSLDTLGARAADAKRRIKQGEEQWGIGRVPLPMKKTLLRGSKSPDEDLLHPR